MTKEECKQRVTAAIQAHKEEIFSLAESVFCEPELGFKETKTAAKIAAVFEKHKIPSEQGLALTGVRAASKAAAAAAPLPYLASWMRSSAMSIRRLPRKPAPLTPAVIMRSLQPWPPAPSAWPSPASCRN